MWAYNPKAWKIAEMDKDNIKSGFSNKTTRNKNGKKKMMFIV